MCAVCDTKNNKNPMKKRTKKSALRKQLAQTNASKRTKVFLTKIGTIGGKIGTGKAKRRGNRSYYAALAAKRWKGVK